jgi:hypothetical protein
MNLPKHIQPAAPITRQTSRVPGVGELVQVRSRRWLVDEVIEPKSLGQTWVVRLSCADDDAQGQSLEVLWDYELDRLILKEEGWADLAAKGFDPPRQFAAFLHTLRWNCVTATDPNLFQSPKDSTPCHPVAEYPTQKGRHYRFRTIGAEIRGPFLEDRLAWIVASERVLRPASA